MAKSLILCDCNGSIPIDAKTIERGAGVVCSRIHSALCTKEIDAAARALAAGLATGLSTGDVIIACQQERALFEELAEDIAQDIADDLARDAAGELEFGELEFDAPVFVDLRDRAGWSDQGADAGAKMAALVAESPLPGAYIGTLDVTSEGTCLIAGPGAVVVPLAEQLAGGLAVTALITDGQEVPYDRGFDAVFGHLKRVSGALGGFDVVIDALQQVNPGGRGAFEMGPPQDGGHSQCDILIDLTGNAPMVPAPGKREGYLRGDPKDPVGVARLAFEAAQLVGVFEKPLYVAVQDSLCAHARAEQVGCSNCLDICPTGAITPDGDHIAIDAMVCAGCGSCAALCPSGAITYQDPPVAHLLTRMQVLGESFRAAGGGTPRLLVHDAHGGAMIRAVSRFGRGLPMDVIPLELQVISGFGHAEMLAALAHGFGAVDILLAPTTERDALIRELALAQAIAGPGRLALLDHSDPDLMAETLYGAMSVPPVGETVLPMGNRRQIARLSAQALNPQATQPLALPAGAPYGRVQVNNDACTLCLSCVSLCPSGALVDNPDMPQLRFQEDACLQCGICATICPESAITLHPQLDLSQNALAQNVLHEEEPFACIECGALFGVKSTVEKVIEKLAGKHPMFANSDTTKLIQMCDDCRIKAQYHSENSPFAAGERPKTRVTEDYFSKRRDH